MKNHVFFDLDIINDKVGFLRDCISKSYKVVADELDCSKSWHRVSTTKSVEDILQMASVNDFYTFIIRYPIMSFDEEYIEAGIRAHSDIDYFLWIYIKVEKLSYFTSVYNISPMGE